MRRLLQEQIQKDLQRKIVIITGPRQAGKTTLAKMVNGEYDYLNYDYAEHRAAFKEKSWDRNKDTLILDELHKMKNWKSWLKGVYDVEGIPPSLLVTGSARIDTFRKAGDSLAGRYFLYHLHPFDIKEVRNEIEPEEAFERIMHYGGFPEPFLENDERFYLRWRKTHSDIILKHDLVDLESVKNITAMETLAELLKKRVGSPVSYANLARDLECDAKTVKRWLSLLENLYVVFAVRPYHKNIARSILKEPKYYFYDTGQVKSGEGGKLENLTACALKKEVDYIEDSLGLNIGLHYLRTKEGREIDFAVVPESGRPLLIEVKTGDDSPSKAFNHYTKFFDECGKIQLVRKLSREKTFPDGTEIRHLVPWLAEMDIYRLSGG
ncbi:MAG: ATP-binding protein [Spirochaetia bacterium]